MYYFSILYIFLYYYCISNVFSRTILYIVFIGFIKSSLQKTVVLCSSSFNIFRADFGHISSQLKNELFQKYCCVFYGSPLWPLEGAMIQSLCVDWRKALRCVWSVNNRTHCDIITI